MSCFFCRFVLAPRSLARARATPRTMASDDEDARMQALCDDFEELCRQLRYHQKECVRPRATRRPNVPRKPAPTRAFACFSRQTL